MNFYTPHGHAAYATQQATNNGNNNHNQHNNNSNDALSHQQQIALQAALHAFDQPPAPSLREVLGAYRLKGDGDREMLLAILNAKAAEDQRIASMAQLHQTILQVTHVHLAQNALANQLPPLVSGASTGPGLGVGLGHSNHSHNQGATNVGSSSPPTRSQLMSISSLIAAGADGEDGRSPRRAGSFSGSASGSRSPASVGTSGDHSRSHRLSSERSTS